MPECAFYDHNSQFGGTAKYWYVDNCIYAFEYENKVTMFQKIEQPNDFKGTPHIPGYKFSLWIRYKDVILCIFDKY